MPEWLKILVTALGGSLVGGAVSGTFLLVADWLRHKRRKVERYQDLLIEKRIAACNDLLRMIAELHRELTPDLDRAELLRWPKDSRTPPDLPEAAVEGARRVAEKTEELTRFVAANHMLLGPEVLQAWYPYYGALAQLIILARTERRDDILVGDALGKLLHPSFDSIAEAVKKELEGAGLDYMPSHQRQALMKQGFAKADRLVAEARERLRGGNPGARQG